MKFWREEFSSEETGHILQKLREIREIGEGGRVRIRTGDLDDLISVLVSAIALSVRTDTLRASIVRAALFSRGLPEDFNEADFKKATYLALHKLQNTDTKSFLVVFPIHNLPSFLCGTRRFKDVTLNFAPSQRTKLFERIVRQREGQMAHFIYEAMFTEAVVFDLNQCSLCLARVRANNPSDAHERASSAVYQILGLVNLARDQGKFSRISSRVGGKLPVSEVLIGPHTTTHFENGSITHEGFWREDWVGAPAKKNLKNEELLTWEKRFLKLSACLRKSVWSEDCRSAAARYFKAFSNPNLEESFLEGWRLFENISGSRYEKIETQINRAANIFQNNLDYRVIGKHLALRRNLLSHGHAIRSEDEETLAFQMLQFVAPFLWRYIVNGFNFCSREEFWEFLDLPASREARALARSKLSGKLALLDKAAKFRGETKG